MIENITSYMPNLAQFLDVFIPFISGSFITITGQMFIAWYELGVSQRKRCNIFVTILKDSLKNSIKIFGQIADDHQTNNRIDTDQINKFKNSRQIYEKFIEDTVLIEPHDFRSRISDYFLDSAALIDQLTLNQNRLDQIDEKIIILQTETSSLGGMNHGGISAADKHKKASDLETLRGLKPHFDKVLSALTEKVKESQNEAETLLNALEVYKT